MVMIHTHAKDQGQKLVGLKVEVKTNRWINGQEQLQYFTH